MVIEDSRDVTANVAADHTIRADASGVVVLPAGLVLAGAEYTRTGDDLMIVTEGGDVIIVEGFFSLPSPPTLTTPDGGEFSGDLVVRLAEGAAEDLGLAADDMVDAGPIGSVVNLDGTAAVLRAGGTRIVLRVGDPVFRGDVLETGEGSRLGIALADETVVSMAENSHLVLDEFVFDPGGSGGSLHFTVLQGVFVFASGLIGEFEADAMIVETPIARVRMGCARAAVSVDGPDAARVVLMRNQDDSIGEVAVANGGGTEILDQVGEFTVVTAYDLSPSAKTSLDDDIFYDIFSDVMEIEPRPGAERSAVVDDDSATESLFDQELGDLEDIERIAAFRTDAGEAEDESEGDAPIRVVDGDYTAGIAVGGGDLFGTEAEVASLDDILGAGDTESGPLAGADFDTDADATGDDSNVFLGLGATDGSSDAAEGGFGPDAEAEAEPFVSDAGAVPGDESVLGALDAILGVEAEETPAAPEDEPAPVFDVGANAQDATVEDIGDGVTVDAAAPVPEPATSENEPTEETAEAIDEGDEGATAEKTESDVPEDPAVEPPTVSVVVGAAVAAPSAGRTPIHYYDFESDDGGVVTDRTGAADGVVADGRGADVHLVDGAFGRAMQFDGHDDVVSIPHASNMALDSGAVTLWFRAHDVDERQGVVSKDARGYGEGGHFTMIIDDGEVKVRLQGDAIDVWVTGGELARNTWHQATVNWGPDGMQLYVDGRLVDSDDYGGGMAGNENPWVVGGNAWDAGTETGGGLTEFFRGRIDDFAIYDAPIAADQAESLFLEGVRTLIDADIPTGTVYPLDVVANCWSDDESLVVTIGGVPESAVLSAGTDNGDGSWTLGPSDLDGLALTLGADIENDVALTIVAVATDLATGRSATSEATATIHVDTAPVLSGDGEAEVDAGGSVVIGGDDLRLTDDEDKPAALTYTLTDGVRLGSLYLSDPDGNRVDLTVGDTFTQFDIESGLLVYEQNIPLGGVVWDPDTPVWGANAAPVLQSNLTMPLQAETVTLTFQGESAGYNNSMGWYKIDSDGNPTEPRIIWVGTDQQDLAEGTEVALDGLAPGEAFGLFIIRDGANRFDWLDRYIDNPMRFGENGDLEFLNGGGNKVMHTVERADVFCTDSSLNVDAVGHAVSGTQDSELMIGFEDLPGGGDADYNDIFVSIRYDNVGGGIPTETDGFTFTAEDSTGAAMVVDDGPDREPGDGYSVTDGEASFDIRIEDFQ